VEVDILKPNVGYVSVERPLQSKTTSTSGSLSPHELDGDVKLVYAEPVSEGEDDEPMDFEPAKDEDKRTRLTGSQIAEAVAYRMKLLQEQEMAKKQREVEPQAAHQDKTLDAGVEGNGEGRGEVERKGLRPDSNARPRAFSIDPLAPSLAFDETLKNHLRATENKNASQTAVDDHDIEEGPSSGHDDQRILVRDWVAPPGKRIAVPVRIEPKVYFACERTFLVSLAPVFHTSCLMSVGRNG
jgi:hypothetical protein